MSVTFTAGIKTADMRDWHPDFSVQFDLSNASAHKVLSLIGIQEIPGAAPISAIRTLVYLLDDLTNVEAPSDVKFESGPRFISSGWSLDLLRHYSQLFEKLVNDAELIEAEFILFA